MIVFLVIAFTLTILYVLLFIYYLSCWVLLSQFSSGSKSFVTRVSVIIPARNEEKNIGHLLRKLLDQKFPEDLFEVIVVDDFSEDNTAQVVSAVNSKNIRLLRMQDFVNEKYLSGKKKALETGVRNSNGTLIITTDADCSMSENWLKEIVSFYESYECCMVVAPVLIKNETGFFSKLLQLDAIGMAGITGATLATDFPTMCNGANLAFTRKAFDEVNGYRGIDKVSSGDDMLLMHKIGSRFPGKVKFLKSNDAVVYTQIPESFNSFFSQRLRWTSKSKSYSDWKIKLNLLLVYLLNLSILVSVILFLLDSENWLLAAFQISAKLIVDFSFLAQTTSFFGKQKLLMLFLPAEIFHVLYIIIIGFAGNIVKTNWKGRRITS